jgi:two-component system response regulator YesN
MAKILFVDDEPLIREGLQQLLLWEEYGIEVMGEASNGAEAWDIIAATPPDILVTDVRMPVMDGLELIGRIRDNKLGVKVVIISGYDEFRYVKEALRYGVENYLVKPINADELSGTVTGILEKLESEKKLRTMQRDDRDVIASNTLYRLATGNISIGEYLEKAEMLGLHVRSATGSCQIALFSFEEGFDAGGMWQRVRDVSMTELADLCGGDSCFDLDGRLVVVLSGSAGAEFPSARLEACAARLRSSLAVSAFVAVGDAQDRLEDLPASYAQARRIAGYAPVYLPRIVVTNREQERDMQWARGILNADFSQLHELVTENLGAGISRFFDSLNGKIRAGGRERGRLAVYAAVETLTQLANTARSAGLDASHILSKYCKPPEESGGDCCRYARQAALAVAEGIRSLDARPRTLIDEIVEHVTRHYGEDLSIKTLAAKYNLSTAYLGQLFKKETGELFTDYLNGIRIRKAKRLLVQTAMKAKEISDRVGYADPNYFYRIFKKYEGVYPSEYRDNRHNKLP